jgi:hypothetical protein
MSNGLAIAATTRVVQSIVHRAATRAAPGVGVGTRPPSRLADGAVQGSMVNVFLFQVIPNDTWRNEDLPARTRGGVLRRRPRVAVDLMYLLSFHGDEAALVPQQMLGEVLIALHREPRLTPAEIRSVLAAERPGEPLTGADLAGQVETITLSLQRMSVEMLSKMWSVLFQAPYALSVFYRASVVVLETADEPDEVPAVARIGVEVGLRPEVTP